MEQIVHEGYIEQVGENFVMVRIMSTSACSTCHAKGACSTADSQDKLIKINCEGNQYKQGQLVTITGNNEQGYKAVLYAYVIPSVLVLTTLIALFSITKSEAIAGVGSLAVLLPYFGIIILLRKQLEKTFSFTINQQST
jgi:sigma-E factor negative regulatory protein RseC